MTKLTWHKLNDKTKSQIRKIRPLTFIPGPIHVDPKRIHEIVEENTRDSTLIFGLLAEEWIPGFENCEQFKTLTYDNLAKSIPEQNQKKLAILNHQFNHIKYILRELKPDKVVWINGSWKNVIHYQSEYWEAIGIDAQIELISPFSSERSAKYRATQVTHKNNSEIKRLVSQFKKTQPHKHEQILSLCHEVSKLSWDWNGQTGAAIARDGKILAYSHNAVLPYESAMMHEGAIREKMHTPIGQYLEYFQTNHAETRAITQLCGQKQSLENTDLYTTKFPCPFCARIIADSPIKRIFYSGEYTNNLGYETLKRAGKKLAKI
ncbi:MAG: deaminase [Patescibacteria group bacterium]|nr:deaminase [Patescibacteria group bacterium]